MHWQLLFTLIAASVGFVSGIWLCWPTAFANPNAIAWIANPPYKSVDGMASLAISQSAQYSTGGLLLVAAFVLQVVAALSPTTTIQAPHPFLQSSFAFATTVVAASLVFAFLISRLAYAKRKEQLTKQVQEALALLAKFPRLTPIP